MLLGGIALMALFQPWQIDVTVNSTLLLCMAIIVVLGTVCSFCFYQAGVGIVGSITGNILSSVEPVASMVISVLFLNVPLTGLDFLGFALILICIPIMALGNGKEMRKKMEMK